MTKSFGEFCRIHFQQKDQSVRLGQRFCNFYIKGQWPELFYEENEQKAAKMIQKWLADNCYFDSLPKKIKRD